MTHSRERRVRWSNLYNFTCDLHLHGHHGISPAIGTEGYSRVVYCNRPDKQAVRYPSNYVSTTKYNLITFFPKALFEQFRRVANIYFLITAALSITPLSPFSAASMIAPLVFVIGVSMAKEALEDWQRFLQDLEVNNRKVLVHQQDGKFEPLEWKKLKVGHIVKVEKDSFFPADLLLLSSSYEDGICYVETMNLDGETNLKLKRSLECTMNLQEDSQFATFSAEVYCEDPNPELYSFVGTLKLSNDSSSSEPSVYPLGPQQILLRDSKLRNTNFIYGAVIFSGPDTKVMQNATPPPSKRSRIEKRMDLIIYLLFVVLFLMSAFGSVIFGIITWRQTPLWWYLRPDDTTIFYNPRRPVVAALLHLVTALILYGYLIPISLYVSIEIVKVAQAMFINQDIEMYDEESDTPARARTSNLNEELGQIDTILSDKTGTLTCNVMEFVKCSIAGVSYGHGVTEVEIAAAQRQGKNVTSEEEIETMGAVVEDNKPHVKGFNLKDERLMNYNWVHQENVSEIQLFFCILAVCNTVVPEEDEETGEIKYEAESPDESAFVVAVRELGFELCKRTQSSVTVKELDLATGQRIEREYRILELLEFSSARKRMSVVVKDEENNLYLFCKGADSVIFERLGQDGRKYEKETREHIAYYAEAGLRTMAVAYRSLDAAEYESWSKEFAKVKVYVGPDRDLKLDEAAELVEKDLILLGATAVEDKLQKGVPQCIDKLARAGIKIWVLTGDKLETAINIGFACSLLRQDMIQLIISLDNDKVKKAETSGDKEYVNKVSQESIKEQIGSCKEQFESQNDNQAFALIIEGRALTYVLGKADETDLMQLAIKCSSVICCRVSPKQKALITRLVKKTTGSITLGIGDGANDVGMIQEAHVGVGISGREGMQATMASDFSIAQFRFLERLLLVHGSWCYKRLAHMICYFFYKNIHFGFTLFYYEAYAAFSGQAAYDDWYLSLFNVFFTSLPVIAYGIFEQDVSAEMKLEFPHIYQQGIHNLHFSWARILGWMANAVGSSLIVFFFTINIIKKQAFRKGGQVSGLEVLGTTLYTCVVWTVNCQLVLFTKYFTWIQHLCIWGSIALWFIFVIIYGYLPPLISTMAYRVFIEACAPSPMYWLVILLVTMAALVPSLVYKSFQNTFCPTDDQIIQEIHYLRKDKDQHWLHKVMENPTIKVLVGVSVRRLQAKALTSKEPGQEAESSCKVTAV